MLLLIICLFTLLNPTFSRHRPESYLQNLDTESIGGSKAFRYQFPYQVSLQKRIDDSQYVHICSGAILSLTWVVTTAFCVSPTENKFRIIAGILHRETVDLDVQIIEVENIIIHPNFKGGLPHSDLALLQLQTSLSFTKAVQPITPAYDEDTWGAAILSSWKVQTRLYKSFSFKGLYYMIVYILTDEECQRAVDNKFHFDNKILCTEKMSDELFCPGESGSPLVTNGYLVGLTSWGVLPCGVTAYTKISQFLDFIVLYVTDI